MNKKAFIVITLLLMWNGCTKHSEELDTQITVSNKSITSEQTYTENKGARSNTNIKNINEHRSNAITRAVNKAEAAIVSITVTELQRGYTRDFDSFFFRFLSRRIYKII